jgi:lysophospholipase L1-like esterase
VHTEAGACWSASFSKSRLDDATQFVATSEDTVLQDRNGNGVREWMMVGDSNTSFLPCAYPQQLAFHHPSVVVSNEGIFGTAASWWVQTGQLPPLLATHKPDAVLIALGTNDLRTRTRDQILADLATLRDEVTSFVLPNGAHPVPYLATIPPVYPRLDTDLEPLIEAVDAGIRQLVPPTQLVDFDSWMPAEWDPDVMWIEGDGVHLGCRGHTRRAEVVEVLTGP